MAQSKGAEKTSGLRQIFNDLSFPQVTAGALAAVTSMLLASNVGIAGTVIGVAVSSVVSAVASQVYKQFILASAEKVKDLAPAGLIPHGASSHKDGADETTAVPEETGLVEKVVASERRTRSFDPYEVRRTSAPAAYTMPAGPTRAYPSARRRPASVSMGEEYARSAIIQARAARERKAKIQRNAIIVAAVSAVVAVAVCALVINVFTQGKGLGPQMPTATYVQHWSSPSYQQTDDSVQEEGEEVSTDSEEEKNTESESKSSSQTNKKENATKPNTGSGSTNGSTSGTANTQNPGSSTSGENTSSGSNVSGTGSQGTQENSGSSSAQEGSSASKAPSETGTASGSNS